MAYKNFSTPNHIDEALQRGSPLSREEKAGMRNYLGTAISSSNAMTDEVRERVGQIREALELFSFDEQGAEAEAKAQAEACATEGASAESSRTTEAASEAASGPAEVPKEIGVESFTLGALGPKAAGLEKPVKSEGPFEKWEQLSRAEALELGLIEHWRCKCVAPEIIFAATRGMPKEMAYRLMCNRPVKLTTKCLTDLPLSCPRLTPYELRYFVGADYRGDLDKPLELSKEAKRARKLADEGRLDDPLFEGLSVQEVLAMVFDLREDVSTTLTQVLNEILSGRVLYRSRGEGGVYRPSPDTAKKLSKDSQSLVDLSPIGAVRQMVDGHYGQFSAQEIVHGLWGFPESEAFVMVRDLLKIFEGRSLFKVKTEEQVKAEQQAEIQSVPDKELIRGLVMRGELDHPLVKDLSAAELFAAALDTSEEDAARHVKFMLRALNGRKVLPGDEEVIKVSRENPTDSKLEKILSIIKGGSPVEALPVEEQVAPSPVEALPAERPVGRRVESPSAKLGKKYIWRIAASVAAAALVAAGLVAIKFKGKPEGPEEDESTQSDDYSGNEMCSDSDVRDKTGRKLNSLSAKEDLAANKALLVLECSEEYASSAELIADFERQVGALKAAAPASLHSGQVFTDNSPDFNSQSFAPTTGSVDYAYGRGGEDPARYFYVRLPRTAATTSMDATMDATEELLIWKEESEDGPVKLVLNDRFIVGYRKGNPVLVEHDAYFHDPINIGGTNVVKSGILKDLNTAENGDVFEGGLYTLDDKFVYGWKVDYPSSPQQVM